MLQRSKEKAFFMGYVVSFTPRPGGAQPKPISAGEAAAIIIFPGVRYERVPDAPNGQPAKANKLPKH